MLGTGQGEGAPTHPPNPQLTDVIVGFADVVIPDGDVQRLLGQVAVLDVVEELLQKEKTWVVPHFQGKSTPKKQKTQIRNGKRPLCTTRIHNQVRGHLYINELLIKLVDEAPRLGGPLHPHPTV